MNTPVVRGAFWKSFSHTIRTGFRHCLMADFRELHLGFRVACLGRDYPQSIRGLSLLVPSKYMPVWSRGSSHKLSSNFSIGFRVAHEDE